MTEPGRTVRSASFSGLSVLQFHEIVRLRLSVFVVEQACAYADLDGRDTQEDTLHMWIDDHGVLAAYLRLYRGPENSAWIGRVVTAAERRNQGFGGHLMRAALERAGRPVRIAAQSQVSGWYGRFGFAAYGPEYDEDGILHTPMQLL